MAGIDVSMYNNLMTPKFESPIDSLNKLAQLGHLESQTALDSEKLARSGRQANLLSNLFTSGAGGNQVNMLMPQNAGGSGASSAGINWDVLQQLAAEGYDTKHIFEVARYLQDGTKLDPNSFRRDARTGQTEYIPDPTKGTDFNFGTRIVSPLAGAAETNAGIKAAETRATEGEKPLPLGYVDRSGRPIGGTFGEYRDGVQGRTPPQQPQPAQSQPLPVGMQQRASMLQSITDPAERQSFANAVYNSFKGHPQADQLGQMWSKIVNGAGQGAQASGYQPPATGVDGNPVPAQVQQLLSGIAATRDPKKLEAMVTQGAAKINAMPDGPQKEIAKQNLQLEARRIEQSWSGQNAQTSQAAPPIGNSGRPVLQSEVEKDTLKGQVKLTQDAQGDVNKSWVTNSHTPIVQAGRDAQSVLKSLDTLANIDLNTGWGTDTAAAAAAVLTGLGVASDKAEKLATNAQTFSATTMDELWKRLNAAKGPQTEGDAERASKTFAQLKNTPQANQFIMDVARAAANADIRRAQYYQDALPIAIQSGDLAEIDRRWNKIQQSIWNDPILQKYAKQKGK